MIHIPDSLLEEVLKIANQKRTTIKALIEEGLRRTIDQRKKIRGFRLRMATFKGNGLQSDAAASSWEKIREISYDGRGG
jgi:hypothetical protein